MSKSECPICKNNNITFDSSRIYPDGAIVICPNCGKYKISGSDFVAMDNNKQDRELSFAIRTRYERGEDVHITTDKNNRRKILSGIELPNTITEKAELLLKKVFMDKNNVQKEFMLTRSNSIQFFIDDNEIDLVIKYLEEEEWFEIHRLASGEANLELTGKGIKYADEIINPNYKSDQVFVAMSFNKELDSVYSQAIQAAVTDCKLKPLRIDDADFNDEIIKNVLDQINRSRFVIADFTDCRPGVYFETGYAVGRKIPVIYSCRDSDKDKIHFDINHNKFIYWTDIEEYKNELIKRIRNTGLIY